MHLKLAAIIGVAFASAGNAAAYDWFDNQHACIVENGTYSKVGSSTLGAWTNAPKTFFVSFQSCTDFAKDAGLSYEVGDLSKSEKIRDQIYVNACVREGVPQDNLLAVDGLEFSAARPIAKFMLNAPISSSSGMMMFGDDGFIDFAQLGTLEADNSRAWWMLRARCTILKR